MTSMKQNDAGKPSGIRQIADALGISIGTVDRALHNRSGVSAKTRDKVLKMAGKLSYTPNVAARNLKLNRRLRLGVYLPAQIASYYDTLREGIRYAAESEATLHIDVDFHNYPSLGEGDLEVMKKTNWLQYDGVILAPGHPNQLTDISRAATKHNRAIVCVTTDAARMSRLAAVTADSFVSGAMAAELLGGWIADDGDVAVFTGDLEVQDHADKLRGFAATLALQAPQLRLAPAVECHDSFQLAYEAARKMLKSHRQLRGIYVNTSNSIPVLQALSESGRMKSIRTITTDLFPELLPYLQRGHVSASLYQRPYTQGKIAVEVLCAFLSLGEVPKVNTHLTPHIILRSNLSLFMEALGT